MGSASGFCDRCSPVRDSLEIGGPADSRGQWPRHLTTDGQPCPEQLTQKPLAGLFGTHTTRPISHSHLTKRPAVARATAGKVLAGGCTRQGQSTRRGLSSPSMRGITSTTWLFDRATWPSFSSSWQRWCHLRPSRPGWPCAAWRACARKAHNVGDNGGAEACSSALQAASLTILVTLRPLLGVWYPLIPDLILRPRKPLDFGELQQPVRRDTTRFFGTRSQVPTDWAAQAIQLERPRLNRTSMDRRRRRKGSVAGRPRNFTP